MPSLAAIPEPFCSEPFRVADALEAGVSRHVLSGPQFRRPFPGVRVPRTLPDALQVRCRAASLVIGQDAAFSHRTAAHLCGIPVPDARGDRGADDQGHDDLHVIVAPTALVPQIDAIVGHTGLDVSDVIELDGLRVVTPARTFYHLAPELSLDDLIILGDAIVRRWCSTEQLIGRTAGLARRRGIVRAREALTLVRPGADSPPETRLRLLLVRAGLPCPELNVDVFDEAGGWLARPDLSYPHLMIAIEYDGDHHRTDRLQWRRDRARDENLRHAGWIVITLTADDLFRHPDRTVMRVMRHYRARAAHFNSAA